MAKGCRTIANIPLPTVVVGQLAIASDRPAIKQCVHDMKCPESQCGGENVKVVSIHQTGMRPVIRRISHRIVHGVEREAIEAAIS